MSNKYDIYLKLESIKDYKDLTLGRAKVKKQHYFLFRRLNPK